MEAAKKKMGQLLFLVSRAHHNLASQTFGQLGLFRGQPPVLFELGRRDGLTQCDLAEIMEVTPATMTNMLRRMEAAGYIERMRDAADTRCSLVYLTENGKKVVAQAHDLADEVEKNVFAGFSPAEMDTMRDFLERMHANLIQQTSPDRKRKPVDFQFP